MSLKDSDQSYFTADSKVKEYLRQSLEDKCSTIGGRQVYFGLNESMIRMLTPVDEVVTPEPGQTSRSVTPELFYAGNTTSWTLLNPEDFPQSLSEQDLTGCNVHKVRCLREPEIGLYKDKDLTMTPTKRVNAQTKSDSATERKQRIPKSNLSRGQGTFSSDNGTSYRDKTASRQSGGQGDKIVISDKKIKNCRKSQNPLVSEQRLSGNGHTVPTTELPAMPLPVIKRASKNRKQNMSSGTGYRSGPRVSFANVSSLPPLAKVSSRVPKKPSTAKPKEGNEIPILPSAKLVSKSDEGPTGTRVGTLPPIASISSRSTSVKREAAREVKLTRSLQFHDTQDVGVTKRKRERVDIVRDNINLPRINRTKRPL